MNLANLETHYTHLQKHGFITNCPPDEVLQIWHDEVSRYCEHLNELALKNGDYVEAAFKSVHLNEPTGNYIAIYKSGSEHEEEAMAVLNAYANKMAHQARQSRSW